MLFLVSDVKKQVLLVSDVKNKQMLLVSDVKKKKKNGTEIEKEIPIHVQKSVFELKGTLCKWQLSTSWNLTLNMLFKLLVSDVRKQMVLKLKRKIHYMFKNLCCWVKGDPKQMAVIHFLKSDI